MTTSNSQGYNRRTAPVTPRPSKGRLEAQIADATGKFQREQQGRGPGDVRAAIVGDMLLIRCRDIFTQTELRLTSTDEGRRLIRSAREELRSINREEFERLLAEILGCGVVRSYGDVDVLASELMEVFVLECDLEERLVRAGDAEYPARNGLAR